MPKPINVAVTLAVAGYVPPAKRLSGLCGGGRRGSAARYAEAGWRSIDRINRLTSVSNGGLPR